MLVQVEEGSGMTADSRRTDQRQTLQFPHEGDAHGCSCARVAQAQTVRRRWHACVRPVVRQHLSAGSIWSLPPVTSPESAWLCFVTVPYQKAPQARGGSDEVTQLTCRKEGQAETRRKQIMRAIAECKE